MRICFAGGESEAERVLVDVMENTAMDFRNGAVRMFYSKKEDYVRIFRRGLD